MFKSLFVALTLLVATPAIAAEVDCKAVNPFGESQTLNDIRLIQADGEQLIVLQSEDLAQDFLKSFDQLMSESGKPRPSVITEEHMKQVSILITLRGGIMEQLGLYRVGFLDKNECVLFTANIKIEDYKTLMDKVNTGA